MNNNPWFAATLGLAGVIVGYAVANGLNGVTSPTTVLPTPNNPTVAEDTTVPTPAPSNNTPAGVDDDPVIGDADAPITLIEFTDYQCPFCARHFTQTYGQIKKEYVDTGKVKIVLRDYPLGFHQHAQKAAEAANCAGDQDLYWEMHDMLFNTQATWSSLADAVPTFKQYAKDLGANASTFDSCLDSDKYKDEIAKDMADGAASGISGTPGFWIIGPDDQSQQVSGAFPYDTFKNAFDGMLQ